MAGSYAATVLATPNLAAYWRLGEPSGTTASDSSGNSRNLTYTGTPTLAQPALIVDADTSVDLNGTTQYAIGGGAGNTGLQGGSAVTLECWARGDVTGNRCPAGLFGSATDKGYWFNFSNPLAFYASNNGSAQTACASVETTATGVTYHMVGTYDGTNMRLYVNGELKATTALAGPIWTVATASSFAIGRLGALSSDYFDGDVDEVAVYNRALSLSEIQAHYTAGLYAAATGIPATRRSLGPSEVTIARPGWFAQQLIQTGPISAAWRTDGPGALSCEIENRTLHKAGLAVVGVSTPLKGKWLWWEHPTAGPWGGVITAQDVGKWYTTITAEQFAVLLRKRRMSPSYGAMSISPGSLALMFLTSASRMGDSFLLTSWTAEECGQAVDIEPRAGDLCDDIIPQLADFGPYQWRVKSTSMAERAFEFRTRVGQDRRGSVLLSEGRHIIEPNDTGDLWSTANSIVGIPGDASYQEAKGYQQDNDRAIRAMGRRYEQAITYPGFVTRSTIVPLVKRDLRLKAYPAEVATFELVDEDSVWASFREGDVVSVHSASMNYRGPVDVDIRSIDMSRQTLTIAGRLRYLE